MFMRRIYAIVAVFAWPGLAASVALGQEPVNFEQEVMAVLSRGGCNQGACHGNLHGKGGFKLSLRGESPAFDWAALTKHSMGRRINLEQPPTRFKSAPGPSSRTAPKKTWAAWLSSNRPT
jgi:hypothetical protein